MEDDVDIPETNDLDNDDLLNDGVCDLKEMNFLNDELNLLDDMKKAVPSENDPEMTSLAQPEEATMPESYRPFV